MQKILSETLEIYDCGTLQYYTQEHLVTKKAKLGNKLVKQYQMRKNSKKETKKEITQHSRNFRILITKRGEFW